MAELIRTRPHQMLGRVARVTLAFVAAAAILSGVSKARAQCGGSQLVAEVPQLIVVYPPFEGSPGGPCIHSTPLAQQCHDGSVTLLSCYSGATCEGCAPSHASACILGGTPCSTTLASCANGCLTEETCDGRDNDGDGQSDGGACEGDINCEEKVGDPVHVGSGFYIGHPIVDARLEAPLLPLEFRRQYTSADSWPAEWQCTTWVTGAGVTCTGGELPDGNRLSRGWFTTFDERLVHADDGLFGTLDGTVDQVIHRSATGRGSLFDCTASGGDLDCSSSESADAISYDATTAQWLLVDGGTGVHTRFSADGRMVNKNVPDPGNPTQGQGWDISWGSATIAGGTYPNAIITEVEHTLTGQKLVFNWLSAWAAPQLASIDDENGVELASFTHGLFLESSDSAAGLQEYTYDEPLVVPPGLPAYTVPMPWLTSIEVDEEVALQNTYWNHNITPRVLTHDSDEGSFRFLYGNLPAPLHGSVGLGSGELDELLESECPAETDPALAVIVADDSQPTTQYTCHVYAEGDTQRHRLTELSGECPCGGSQEISWITTPGRDRVAWRKRRDGAYHTYAYNADGLLIAECDGDTGPPYTVDTSPSSCPATGLWRAYVYGDPDLPSAVTEVQQRSRLDTEVLAKTVYTHDAAGQVTSVRREGVSRDVTGDSMYVTEHDSWTYDDDGRMSRQCEGDSDGDASTCSTGVLTTYTYYATGAAHDRQMLYEVERHIAGTTLVTTYSDYNAQGRPGTVVDEAGISTALVYDDGTGRIDSWTRAGQTWTMAYTSGGRLDEVVDPTGRIVRFVYDEHGRVTHQRTYDHPTAGSVRDEIEFGYDDAGRRTDVIVRRAQGTSTELSRAYTVQATYDESGYLDSRTVGPRGAETYGSNTLGFLTALTRAGGDTEQSVPDAYGRETELTRELSGPDAVYQLGYSTTVGDTAPDLRPTLVTDPDGDQRSYEYDDFGRLITSTSVEDFGTQRWQYDWGRVLATKHPSGHQSTFSHDALGRVTFEDHGGSVGQDYEYLYDNGDSAVSCPFTSCAYRVGRLARARIQVASGTWWEIDYNYGSDGQLTAERWPGGRQTTYDYDSDGRLDQVNYSYGFTHTAKYFYDTVADNGMDPTEVVHIGGTGTMGTVYWLTNIERDSLGRALEADLHGQSGQLDMTFRDDGAPTLWQVLGRYGSKYFPVISRNYFYEADGMTAGYDGPAPQYEAYDPPRRFFYDEANRLVCAASDDALSACPTSANDLVESYTYDRSSNRLGRARPAGPVIAGTTYTVVDNEIDFENGPGDNDSNHFYNFGGAGHDAGRVYDDDAETPGREREYYFDGLGRVNRIDLRNTAGQNRQITILYDHRSRPIFVMDAKVGSGAPTAARELFWDKDDQLIAQIHTPNIASPSQTQEDIYVHLSPGLVGVQRQGAGSSDGVYYDVRDPVGLPVARFEVDLAQQQTTQTWRGTYSPFGELLTETGNAVDRPPWRFEGQLELWGSAAPLSNEVRAELYLNQWRIYDPRVGQYISAEPLVRLGAARFSHPFSYSYLAPALFVDPDGLSPRQVYLLFKRIITGRQLPFRAAVRELEREGNVFVPGGERAARSFGRKYSTSCGGPGRVTKPERHPIRNRVTREVGMGERHLHGIGPNGTRLAGHIFFGYIPLDPAAVVGLLDMDEDGDVGYRDALESANPLPIPLTPPALSCAEDPWCA